VIREDFDRWRFRSGYVAGLGASCLSVAHDKPFSREFEGAGGGAAGWWLELPLLCTDCHPLPRQLYQARSLPALMRLLIARFLS